MIFLSSPHTRINIHHIRDMDFLWNSTMKNLPSGRWWEFGDWSSLKIIFKETSALGHPQILAQQSVRRGTVYRALYYPSDMSHQPVHAYWRDNREHGKLFLSEQIAAISTCISYTCKIGDYPPFHCELSVHMSLMKIFLFIWHNPFKRSTYNHPAAF